MDNPFDVVQLLEPEVEMFFNLFKDAQELYQAKKLYEK